MRLHDIPYLKEVIVSGLITGLGIGGFIQGYLSNTDIAGLECAISGGFIAIGVAHFMYRVRGV